MQQRVKICAYCNYEIHGQPARSRRDNKTLISEQYNEARLRIEFINPFFEALGWDISNRQGYAEAYKDVVFVLAAHGNSLSKRKNQQLT